MGIGFALKHYRLRAGLKQKDLARSVGTSASYLSLVESDARRVTVDLLTRLAQALKVPVELLLLEAREGEKKLSPEEHEIFDRAKRLLLIASDLADANQQRHASRISASPSKHSKSEVFGFAAQPSS